jgi:hypothetical protein
MLLITSVVKLVKNTHRHPANRALHIAGAPVYAAGAFMVFGGLFGFGTDMIAGAAMWLAAIAMFVAGHRIEGNAGSMTPVLIFRLLSRKVAGYRVAQRAHFLRA